MFAKVLSKNNSDSSDRSKSVRKNLAGILVVKIISVVINFLLVPIIISYIDVASYGIWLTLTSLIAWIGFFDIGLSNGLRNKFVEALVDNDVNRAKMYVSTTYALLTIIVVPIWFVLLVINCFLDWNKLLNLSGSIEANLNLVVAIILSYFCIQFILKSLNAILLADRKPAQAAAIDMAGQLLVLFFLYLIVKMNTSGSLVELSLVLGIIPTVVLIACNIGYFSQSYKAYRPSIRFIDFSCGRELLSLGFKFFFIQIAVVVIFQTSNILITRIFGAEEVAAYNIAFKYFSVITMVSTMFMAPLWSYFTEAYLNKDYLWIINQIKKMLYLWLLLLFLSLGMLYFSPYFYKLWVGDSVFVNMQLSLVVMIYSVLSALGGVFINFLNGIGKIRMQMYIITFFALIYIPLALYLSSILGVIGIVLATILCNSYGVTIAPIQCYKILNSKLKSK